MAGFLMQIDKLVQLLESPIFIHLRLVQLLEVDAPHHPALVKSLTACSRCCPSPRPSGRSATGSRP